MFALIRQVHSELEGFKGHGRDAADTYASPVSACNPQDLRVVNGGKTTVCADGNAVGRWDRPVFHVDEPLESQSGAELNVDSVTKIRSSCRHRSPWYFQVFTAFVTAFYIMKCVCFQVSAVQLAAHQQDVFSVIEL